jgi:excisionase family DNA binding protein
MNKLLTPQDLANYLGLALQTIYNRRRSGGSLPRCISTGRLIRFHPRDVEAWLAGQYEKPMEICPQGVALRRRGRPTKAEQVAHRQSTD